MPITILLAVLEEAAKYGPDALAAGQRLVAIVKANHTPLTPADIAMMEAFGAKTPDDYLADAGGAPATTAQ